MCDHFTNPITKLKVKVQAMRMLSINCYSNDKKGDQEWTGDLFNEGMST